MQGANGQYGQDIPEVRHHCQLDVYQSLDVLGALLLILMEQVSLKRQLRQGLEHKDAGYDRDASHLSVFPGGKQFPQVGQSVADCDHKHHAPKEGKAATDKFVVSSDGVSALEIVIHLTLNNQDAKGQHEASQDHQAQNSGFVQNALVALVFFFALWV